MTPVKPENKEDYDKLMNDYNNLLEENKEIMMLEI